MSLEIDVDQITEVLLPDGKWYQVEDVSFRIDAYEFAQRGETIHRGGASGANSPGFTFKSGGHVMAGPLTAIWAVRVGPEPPELAS